MEWCIWLIVFCRLIDLVLLLSWCDISWYLMLVILWVLFFWLFLVCLVIMWIEEFW